jgi:hypothetical protein
MTAIKTYHYDFGWLGTPTVKVSKLCIFRDLRDVYSSRKKKRDETIGEFIERTRNELEALATVASSGEMLFQKYEKVIGDLESATREIAAFLGLEPSQEDIAHVAQVNSLDAAIKEIHASFTLRDRFVSTANRFFVKRSPTAKKIMRAIGATGLIRRFIPQGVILSPSSRLHPDHISTSRGVPGQWQQEISQEEANTIKDSFREWFEQHGYV